MNDRVYRALSTSSFLCNIALYVLAQILKDNGIVDITWGLVFVIGNIAQLQIVQNFQERSILVFVLLIAWAARLGINNYFRHNGEDWRYAEMRQKWMKKGKCFYYFAAFFLIYVPQSIFQVLLNSSALFVTIYTRSGLGYLDLIGFGVWIIGFIIELVADSQLLMFKKNRLNKGKLLTTGLWRYSRHPNYFGEALMWWGIYIIACQVYLGYITIFAPVLMIKTPFEVCLANSDTENLGQTSFRVQILKELDSERQDLENPENASFGKELRSDANDFQNSLTRLKKPTIKIQPHNSDQQLQYYKQKPVQGNDKPFTLDSFKSDDSSKISQDTNNLKVMQESTYLSANDSKMSKLHNNILSPQSPSVNMNNDSRSQNNSNNNKSLQNKAKFSTSKININSIPRSSLEQNLEELTL
eukprot:403372263